MKKYTYIDIIGEIGIDSEDVENLYHSGQCYADCAALESKYSDQLNHHALLDKIDAIEQYGFELDEDEKQDETELNIKLLWLAAGNIAEDEEL